MDITLLIIQAATLVALTVYVVKTWHMATATEKAAKSSADAIEEMRATREAESRPYVSVFVEPNKIEHHVTDLVVRNYGKTAAHGLSLGFDPPLQAPLPDLTERCAFLTGGVALLPPGASIRTALGPGARYVDAKLPTLYALTIEYSDDSGNHRYKQEQVLDVVQCRGAATVCDSDRDKVVAAASEASNALSRIRAQLERIADRLDSGVVSSRFDGGRVWPGLEETLKATRDVCEVYLRQDDDSVIYPLSSEVKDLMRQQRRLLFAAWSSAREQPILAPEIGHLVAVMTEVVEHEFCMDGGESLDRLRDALQEVGSSCAELLESGNLPALPDAK
jgi:hypothetical protein